MTGGPTPTEVAEWMLAELRSKHVLDQHVAAKTIQAKFGDDHTYTNDNGNLAISKRVLKEFKRLSGDVAVWERWGYRWRLRLPTDPIGRRRAD